MSDIEWGAPPPTSHGQNSATKYFVAALKERPGEWAKYPKSMASGSTGNVYKRQHPGTEWTTRRRDDLRYDMWGRWVGDPS